MKSIFTASPQTQNCLTADLHPQVQRPPQHHPPHPLPHPLQQGLQQDFTVDPEATLQQHFEAMLSRLGEQLALPPDVLHAMTTSHSFILDEVPLALELEQWSGVVKVFADAGLPSPACLPMLQRYLMEQHLFLPAPLQMVSCLHPVSGHVVLLAWTPLSRDANSDRGVMALLQACVAAVAMIRADWSELAS